MCRLLSSCFLVLLFSFNSFISFNSFASFPSFPPSPHNKGAASRATPLFIMHCALLHENLLAVYNVDAWGKACDGDASAAYSLASHLTAVEVVDTHRSAVGAVHHEVAL